MTPVSVISLESEISRRKHIDTTFTALNIPFEFFDAIDKENLSRILDSHTLSFVENSLTQGEMACFCSHYLLWKQMIDENQKYMVICEDDVIMSSKIHDLFDHLDEIMTRCEILKFETMKTPTLLANGALNFTNFPFQIKKLTHEHMGMAGYVITQSLARRLLEMMTNSKLNKPIDHYLFDYLVTTSDVFQVVPALAIQDDVLHQDSQLISALNEERKIRRTRKIKLTLLGKLSREIKRLLSQLKPAFWASKYRRYQLLRRSIVVPFEK